MRASRIALIVLAGLALAACTRRSSLFMEPGKPEPGKSAKGRDAPPPPGGAPKPQQ